MGIQDLLIANKVGYERDVDTEARRFLETVTLDEFRDPATWKRLRGVAFIQPENDFLPFRTEYQLSPNPFMPDDTSGLTRSINIGTNHVVSACPAWYAFADVIKSKFFTGKCPKILETIELIPSEEKQPTLRPFKFFGRDEYRIDLTKNDLFTRIIDMRIEIQDQLKDPNRDQSLDALLHSMQNATKLLASATSYGVLIEVIVDEHKDVIPTSVYHGGEHTRKQARARTIGDDGKDEISDYKAEKPGKYFAPFGVLIPAAGRLMLGIAEKLAADRGLLHAFADTDSMFFCRPDGVPREKFHALVKGIAGTDGWRRSARAARSA